MGPFAWITGWVAWDEGARNPGVLSLMGVIGDPADRCLARLLRGLNAMHGRHDAHVRNIFTVSTRIRFNIVLLFEVSFLL